MTIPMRYGVLLLMIIGYYIQFFIPLYSIDSSLIADPVTTTLNNLPWLTGISIHKYHYMTVGLMPFIFAGVIMQLMLWLFPNVYEYFSSSADKVEKTQRFLTYFLAMLYIMYLLIKMPNEIHKYSWVVTGFELLLSVFFTENVFTEVKKTKTINSPVMLFLGLNIVGVLVQGVTSINYAIDLNKTIFWLIVAFLGAVTTLYAVSKMDKLSEIIQCKKIDLMSTSEKIDIPVKILRTGITPLIYTSFILFPIIVILSYRDSSQVGHSIYQVLNNHSAYWLLIFTFVYFFSVKLIRVGIPVKQITQFCCEQGVYLLKNNLPIKNNQHFFDGLIRKHALIVSVWFLLLLFTQMMWQVYTPNNVAYLGCVGGTGMVLLFIALRDIKRSYKVLKLT